ncbi:hypothetical protein NDU88_006584 [Pleurodeles waltl]|uniref:Secreted protein n=1 Tax=Pleurodeles waltl TaxID=8319 RepID=A0AAV7SQ33_PLEWA|nr:hypothetical protein NDU88_006584 [Pleurodeles waltl]
MLPGARSLLHAVASTRLRSSAVLQVVGDRSWRLSDCPIRSSTAVPIPSPVPSVSTTESFHTPPEWAVPPL